MDLDASFRPLLGKTAIEASYDQRNNTARFRGYADQRYGRGADPVIGEFGILDNDLQQRDGVIKRAEIFPSKPARWNTIWLRWMPTC